MSVVISHITALATIAN